MWVSINYVKNFLSCSKRKRTTSSKGLVLELRESLTIDPGRLVGTLDVIEDPEIIDEPCEAK